jgi:tRNA (cytidine/uridine-2'-O-)-methyltransferase
VFHLILYQPEIPPNTGNIIRLCANVGAQLHLVHPLGFDMNERALRRAGLDYHEFVDICEHAQLSDCLDDMDAQRVFAMTTKGHRSYFDMRFRDGDAFLFGPETRGLPAQLLGSLPPEQVLRLPMRPENRSLNLANSAAVVLYEAWRQVGFDGAV